MRSTLTKLIPAIAIGVTTLLSCTKTEIVPYEAEAVNTISEYKVINGVEQLNGVIDNVNNTITVYIPYYFSIDYLVSTIKVKEGATLIDSKGDEIDVREVLDPIPYDTVGLKYRVKDKQNTIREYTLEVVIMPHKERLALGYSGLYSPENIWYPNETATKTSFLNARIRILGNFQSTSRNVKMNLIEEGTNKIMPNALKFNNIVSGREFYTLYADISPDASPGKYYITIEQQGRKDTLPQITLDHKLPYFGQMPKIMKQGEVITLPVSGPSSNSEVYSGTNPGITKAYLTIRKQYMQTLPAGFSESLLDNPIELDITNQTRTEVSFRFPDLPAGMYGSMSSTNSSSTDGYSINYAGLEIRFDFDYSPWAKGQLRAMGNLLGTEILAK